MIDIGGSKVQVKFNLFPTMTATRCANTSYWSTEMQRKFMLEELRRGQGGNPDTVDMSMVKPRAMGHIIGNAIAVPVFRQVLEKIMIGLRASR